MNLARHGQPLGTPSFPRERRIHIVQGEHGVDGDPHTCLTTLLGSCVAACLWDPVAAVGGMNHFLLPQAPEGVQGDRRYGVQAMELLINGLLARGAARDRLRAKVFGGARMTVAMADIGARNALFITRFLEDESIPLDKASLGGTTARRIRFWPHDGRALQFRIEGLRLDERPASPPPIDSGCLELF